MSVTIHLYERFPVDKKCIVCGESDDTPCVLILHDGTEHDGIAEAEPVHINCAIATNYNSNVGVIYRKTKR